MTAVTADAFALPSGHAAPAPRDRFEDLVERYAKDLHRYAYRLCRDRTLAEDLVQETFARAWRSLGSMRDGRAARSWLTTILRREHARLYERYQPDFKEVETERLPGWDGDDKSTEAFVLRRALEGLPREYRDPLMLQVLGGHSCEEIGHTLGISRGAVMTRVFRAKQKLRTTLEEPAG